MPADQVKEDQQPEPEPKTAESDIPGGNIIKLFPSSLMLLQKRSSVAPGIFSGREAFACEASGQALEPKLGFRFETNTSAILHQCQ
jgi:hypothetical protein